MTTARRLLLPLLSLVLVLAPVSNSLAVSISDYFTLSFEATFSKDTVAPGEAFAGTVVGTAVCKKNLPWPMSLISNVQVTGRIVGVNSADGTKFTLNPSYSVGVSPIPTTVGASAQQSTSVALKFPANAPPGVYTISGETISASAAAGSVLGNQNIKSYLPPSIAFGSITVSIPAPVPTPTPTPTPAPGGGGGGGGGGGAAPKPTPTPTPTPTVTPSPTPTPVSLRGKGLKAGFELSVGAGGKVNAPGQLRTDDDMVTLKVDSGTSMKNANGAAMEAITAARVEDPPQAKAGHKVVAAYEFGPEGTQFDPPITITIAYDPGTLGAQAGGLTIALLNGSQYETQESTVNEEEKTVSASISHFSTYALIVDGSYVPPAPTTTAPPASEPAPTTSSPVPVATTEPATLPDGPETPDVPVTPGSGIDGDATVKSAGISLIISGGIAAGVLLLALIGVILVGRKLRK